MSVELGLKPTPREKAKNSLIFALDVASREDALRLVEETREYVGIYKIGLQLFTAEGPELVRKVHDLGGAVFLDLKLHDIPATVERASKAAVELGVQMFTVHTGEGPEIVAAAVRGVTSGRVDAKGDPGVAPTVLGVTVLTSLTEETLKRVGWGGDLPSLVMKRSTWAVDAGCPGLVCSPHEVRGLRELHGDEVTLVVPGVRPAWAQVGGDDQARKATPREVVLWGGDHVVVGRPIRDSGDPKEAARRVHEELEEVHTSLIR